jgi:hypothetical protein
MTFFSSGASDRSLPGDPGSALAAAAAVAIDRETAARLGLAGEDIMYFGEIGYGLIERALKALTKCRAELNVVRVYLNRSKLR